MKLFVSGRFVDLSFETTPPLTLAQQFANHQVAISASRAMAIMLGLDRVTVHDAQTNYTGVELIAPKKVAFKKRSKRERVKQRMRSK